MFSGEGIKGKWLYTLGRQGQMLIGTLYLQHSSWRADSWWIYSEEWKEGWIWNRPSLSCIKVLRGYGPKQLWPQKVYFGGTSESQRLPEWQQDCRPKVWGESVSLKPLGEEVEDRNNRAESQAASQKAWASCLSQPGTSGHVSTSCPQKTSQALCREFVCLRAGGNMATLHLQVAYFPALGFIFWVDILQAHSERRVQSGVQQLHTVCIYWLSKSDARHVAWSCVLNHSGTNRNVSVAPSIESPKSWQGMFWAHGLGCK